LFVRYQIIFKNFLINFKDQSQKYNACMCVCVCVGIGKRKGY
jgi:hypothetical protein